MQIVYTIVRLFVYFPKSLIWFIYVDVFFFVFVGPVATHLTYFLRFIFTMIMGLGVKYSTTLNYRNMIIIWCMVFRVKSASILWYFYINMNNFASSFFDFFCFYICGNFLRINSSISCELKASLMSSSK